MGRLLPGAALVASSILQASLAGADGLDLPTFHGDRERTGWHSSEHYPTPADVQGGSFGLAWESAPFDSVEGIPPRIYASPLYVDRLQIRTGEYLGRTFSLVFAATSNGMVYAVNAYQEADVPPGTIIWSARLGTPCRREPNLLDGVLTGVLGTPVIDIRSERLYVTSCERQEEVKVRWQVHALDMGSGESLAGWPVELDHAGFNRLGINRNAGGEASGPPRRFDYTVQRGALNLSPDGGELYVALGDSTTGWMVAIDTDKAAVASAFATVANPHHNSGGVWGVGGPAVDDAGNVFIATGTNFSGYVDQPHDWVQSVLKLEFSDTVGFALRGTYTPFNYCETAEMDIDLGSGGAALLPGLDPATTATPELLVVGGKQGNVYLVNRADMPGRLDRRQPCSTDSSSDLSLLPPGDQPHFGKRGPLNVFGPYTETAAAMNLARSRSVPAHFRDKKGVNYLYVTGTTKREVGSSASVPPSLARLEVVLVAGENAYLRLDQAEPNLVFRNPGSPVVTSDGARHPIVWVLDMNAERTVPLVGEDAPRPVLYALDALTLELLWRSASGQLRPSGKYIEPAFGRGAVFVGTDRIQAFASDSRSEDGAAPPPPKRDGGSIYGRRCAACHDRPEGRIPPKDLIGRLPRQYVAETLTSGPMQEHAKGLSADEIDAVAGYLTQH